MADPPQRTQALTSSRCPARCPASCTVSCAGSTAAAAAGTAGRLLSRPCPTSCPADDALSADGSEVTELRRRDWRAGGELGAWWSGLVGVERWGGRGAGNGIFSDGECRLLGLHTLHHRSLGWQEEGAVGIVINATREVEAWG